MTTPERGLPKRPLREGAGLGAYLKRAFFFRWNLLLFAGASAAAILSPLPGVLLPLVAAGELSYLAGLVSIPKFRAAIDARVHQEAKGQGQVVSGPPPSTMRSVGEILDSLPADARRRFDQLRARCVEMRAIAHGVRGGAGAPGGTVGEEIRTPVLDRLLWLFLRLLRSQDALGRFLRSTNEAEISKRVEELKTTLAAQGQGDERMIRSLQDSVAVNELRLENYRKAEKNAEFVAIELDRIEGKIQVLTETAVNRQDPDFLSSQVDSVAESMRQTEKAIGELQHITGLSDELDEPPPILDTDLRGVLRSEA
jgi:phage terminase Nu1 subunit (DNA packaging protein)